MRFCPFCAQENADDAEECGLCGKRMPPVRPSPQRTALPLPSREPKPLRARRLSTPGTRAATLPPVSDPTPTSAPAPPPPTIGVAPPTIVTPAPVMSSTPTRPVALPPEPQTRPSISAPPQHARPNATIVGLPVLKPVEKKPAPVIVPESEDEAIGTEPTPKIELDTGATEPNEKIDLAVDPKELHKRAAAVPDRAPSLAPDDTTDPDEETPELRLAKIADAPLLTSLKLPPMPAAPPARAWWPSVKYLWPLGRALMARRRAQKAIRQLLVGDQQQLDHVLRELGKTIRRVDPGLAIVADDMQRVLAGEQIVAKADTDLTALSESVEGENQRYTDEQATLQAALAALEAELRDNEGKLKHETIARRGHLGERDRLDQAIRDAERKAAGLEDKAQKAELLPPDKGGGPNTAANLRTQAELLRKEATANITPRDDARARAEALDAPIAALGATVTELKAGVAEKRAAVTAADKAHRAALDELAAQKRAHEAARSGAEREISQRFVAAGTVVNLNRVEHAELAPVYARIDDLKRGMGAREAALLKLDNDRRGFDRQAVQRGLILVGSSFGALVLTILLLVILLAR